MHRILHCPFVESCKGASFQEQQQARTSARCRVQLYTTRQMTPDSALSTRNLIVLSGLGSPGYVWGTLYPVVPVGWCRYVRICTWNMDRSRLPPACMDSPTSLNPQVFHEKIMRCLAVGGAQSASFRQAQGRRSARTAHARLTCSAAADGTPPPSLPRWARAACSRAAAVCRTAQQRASEPRAPSPRC